MNTRHFIAASLTVLLLGCATDRIRTPPCDRTLVPINAPVTSATPVAGATHER